MNTAPLPIPQTDAPADVLRIAQTVQRTEAEGPGERFAIWLQGCPLRCPGCCNPEMLTFRGGEEIPVAALADVVLQTHRESPLEGITLMGGEPFSHARAAAELARLVRAEALSVMVFSGYTIEQLRGDPNPHVKHLLDNTDILVDGPYLRDEPETDRRWIGSSNQRVYFLTDRHSAEDPRWNAGNTIEVRFKDGEIMINGFPAQAATGLWKRVDAKQNVPPAT